MQMVSKPPKINRLLSNEAAFDYVADALVKRRVGYVSEWKSLSNWAPDDWDRWLNALDEHP